MRPGETRIGLRLQETGKDGDPGYRALGRGCCSVGAVTTDSQGYRSEMKAFLHGSETSHQWGCDIA